MTDLPHDETAYPPWPPLVGEALPRAVEAYGVREKLAGYSLDLAHKDGGPKARGFQLILGITIEDIDYLERTIRAAILTTPVSSARLREPYGAQCEIRIPVKGLGAKSDRTVDAITGWEYTEPGAPPRMTTAYLKPR